MYSKVWSVGVRSVEWKVWSVKCGVWSISEECKVWSVESKV